MKLRIKMFSDPKHLAWASWTFLANNTVNKTTYLIFCLADLVIIMFYSFNIVQRVHFSNFDYSKITNEENYNLNNSAEMFDLTKTAYETDNDYLSGGIQLTFLRSVDYSLNAIVRENGFLLLMCTVGVLAGSLFVLGVFFGVAATTKNHQNLEKGHFMKRAFCFFLVALMTFLHMPLFDVIVRTIVSTYVDTHSQLSIIIIKYVVSGLAILAFSLIMVFLTRVFNVCIPTELIPWCSPVSKIVFLNLVIKAALVVCNAFDVSGQYALTEAVFFFVLQGFQAAYRVLFAPNYVKEIDVFVKTKDFAVWLVFFIGIICKTLNDKSNYDMVYFIIFIPIVTAGWILFEAYRMQIILLKVKNRELKMEIENEFALHVMMTLVRDCMEDTVASQKVFGQLMDLVLAHIEDCDDQLCICDEMENFYELLRLRQLHNQEVFPLMRAERKKYKKIIDDQGLIGTVSNITDLTLKINSTQSTVQRGNNGQNGEDSHEQLNRHDEDDEQADKTDAENRAAGKKMTVEEREAQKKRKRKVYKINIDETKHRFLSELLYLFYFEMIQKFPDSFKIQLLSNYFALLFKKKEMLCIFQMRSFMREKLSKLDQCCYLINEQYLLMEVAKIQKVNLHANSNIQEGNFNGDYFIRMNQLYKDFNLGIEALSASVVTFWKIFERPSMDVDATYKCGQLISKNIQDVFKTFRDLDSMKIFKDYQMYFQFAILQLHILNDPVAYELYIGKMKSILEINKVYQKNFTQSGAANSDQANFIIVDANGLKFGQIIQANNSLRQLLGWSEEDVKRFRIEDMMPGVIRQKHPEFMNRYNKTGQSYIINNKVTMFIKKVNGYVIPVELYIKFHYSVDYQYTFLAVIKPFYEMAPFTNGVKYNISQLLFLIVEDDEQGRITEFSESAAGMLALYGFTSMMEAHTIVKNINDVVSDIDFREVRKGRSQRYITNEVYEKMHRLDLNEFSDNNSMSHDLNKKSGKLYQSMLMNNGGSQLARTRIFEERYSGGVLDMSIFCFAFVQEGTELTTNSHMLSSKSSIDAAGSSESKKVLLQGSAVGGIGRFLDHGPSQAIDRIEELDEEHFEEKEVRDQSHSMTGSSSSMKDSSASMAEFRSFHSFTEQGTPKTLLLVIKLIVALYLIMLTVASVNLGINITRQNQSEGDVHTVRQAFDRMNWLSMNQLLVRVLLNIANGYEPEDSILISDRYNKYAELQGIRIQQLKDTQSHLQRSNFEASEELQQFRSVKNVPLYYLNENNQPYLQYESLNIAFNLYIAKLTELNSYNKSQLIGNLSIQTLNQLSTNTTYRPSYIEQGLYFIVQNGNRELRQFAIDASNFYARESEIHAEQNIVSTKVTAIVSIIVIVIIGLVIAPILTTAEIRKYRALAYFLKIPRDKFSDLIKNCEYCLNMNDEARYIQIQKDYEDFLGIKIMNQQVEQLRQARDQLSNVENQQASSGSHIRSSEIVSSNKTGSKVTSTTMSKQGQLMYGGGGIAGTIDDYSYLGSSIDQQTDVQSATGVSVLAASILTPTGNYKLKDSNQLRLDLEPIVEQDDEIMMDHNEENDQDLAMDQKDLTENTNKFNLQNLNIKQNRSKDNKTAKQFQNESQELSNKSQQELDSEQRELNDMQQKERAITARANKRRSIMIFSSLSIIVILSLYFVIAYFLAMKTFQTAAQVIESLEIIFYKGSCFDSAMNFLRESQIRNVSMTIPSAVIGSAAQQSLNLNATDYYIDFCFKKEVDYNKMRISLPAYFNDASDFIQGMESSDMCSRIYTGDYSYLRDKCNQALNGILNKGLTNAFYFMFTQILKANQNFLSLGDARMRNETILRSMMLDQSMIQIIDMKAQVLDPSLSQLKQKCTESVIVYIQRLLNDFITAYIVFAALLTAGLTVLVLFGFKILKRSMWDSNIILKIIPFETLPKQDRIEIKDFFNS